MAIARALSAGLLGIRGQLVEIEADIGSGSPKTKLVGLPDPGLREAKDRVRSAVRNSGHQWPDGVVTLGLSPANVPKMGSGYDVSIAAAVLAASGRIPAIRLLGTVLIGELALDGRVRPVRGVLPGLLAARAAGHQCAVVAMESLTEAALVEGLEVWGAARLAEVVDWLRGEDCLAGAGPVAPPPDPDPPDLADVVGQPEARWALEVAAAGAHHLLMSGPPGVGKTLLARRLPGLLPALADDEALDVIAVRSIQGELSSGPITPSRVPPFVAPHHSISIAGLVGGGTGLALPGAVSQAHRGVLFIDEACEHGPQRLETLRTAIEDGQVRIARVRGTVCYPARFQLVLATNPCPCAPASDADCVCPPQARRRYLARLSGPLLDRVDLRVRLRPLKAMRAHDAADPEPTTVVRERVLKARDRAAARWADRGWRTNSEVPGPVLRREYAPPDDATRLLERGLARGSLSARGVDRCLRVAWTLSDLADTDRPTVDQVAAALEFRDRWRP